MLSNRFNMKDLGEAQSVLGIKIIQDHDQQHLSICQSRKINDILSATKMTNCKPVSTPMTPGLSLPNITKTSANDLLLPYRHAIGMLLYVANSS
jgi:hypothetical protein